VDSLLAGREVVTSFAGSFPHFLSQILRRETMKVKINEDWLATLIAFVLLILAMVNFIKPDWVKF